jgi:hypothetical protein
MRWAKEQTHHWVVKNPAQERVMEMPSQERTAEMGAQATRAHERGPEHPGGAGLPQKWRGGMRQCGQAQVPRRGRAAVHVPCSVGVQPDRRDQQLEMMVPQGVQGEGRDQCLHHG